MKHEAKSSSKAWRTVNVEDVCATVSVGIVVQPTQYYVTPGNGVRAFRSANVGENKIIDRDWVYLSFDGHQTNSKSALQTGDVLVVRSGAPGTACIVTEQYAGCNCIDIVFARPRQSEVISEYLAEFTNSPVGKRHVLGMQGGLALQHFNVGAYKKLELLLPSLAEQRSIVDVLAAWNAAIEKTGQLIAAKLHRNQVLSNQLLFGHARFRKGNTKTTRSLHWFSAPSDWTVVEIGKVACEVSTLNENDDELPILSCTKHHGLVDSLKYFDKKVFSHDTSKSKIVLHGQFAYATNHIEEGSIGYQDLVPAGLVSPIYTVFQTNAKKIDDGYLYKLLKTEKLRQIFSARTNSSVDRRGSLRWKDFAHIHIPLPPLDEQREINAALDDAQREIDLLQSEVKALKQQKRGLMQKLLTGQWRVQMESNEVAA